MDKRGAVYFADSEELITADPNGNTVSVQKCPYGFALVDDKPYCPITPNELPVKAPSPTLIGVSQREGLRFWLSEQQSGNSDDRFWQTELVVSRGVAPWKRLALNEQSGVIRELRAPSQVGWVEVSPSGEVYVLGWLQTGLKGSVGLWRIRLDRRQD